MHRLLKLYRKNFFNKYIFLYFIAALRVHCYTRRVSCIAQVKSDLLTILGWACIEFQEIRPLSQNDL